MTDKNYDMAEKLQKLSMLMHRLNRPEPRPHGPRGRSQERALNQIALRDGLTQRELMEKLGIQPSTVSELVGKLETNGLVERRPGADDRRQVELHISERGRQHLERLNLEENRFDPFEVLSDSETEVLSSMFDRLISAAEQECRVRGLPLHPPRPFPPEAFGPHGHRPPPPPFGKHRGFGPVQLADTEDGEMI